MIVNSTLIDVLQKLYVKSSVVKKKSLYIYIERGLIKEYFDYHIHSRMSTRYYFSFQFKYQKLQGELERHPCLRNCV